MHPVLQRVRQKIKVPTDLVYLFDGETGLNWHFSESELRYYSFRSGVLNSRITLKNLPNPEVLFNDRCNRAGIAKGSEASNQLRPTLDCRKLWEHKGSYEQESTGLDALTLDRIRKGKSNANIHNELQSDKAKRK